MGWKPADVYASSVLEFAAAFKGWSKFHCVQKEQPMTHAELDDLIREYG